MVNDVAVIEKNMNEKAYYFILHQFDKVILGKKGFSDHDINSYKLRQAIEREEILELHLFNEEREVFWFRDNEQLKQYEKLEHLPASIDNENVIERKYELDIESKDFKYLYTKEYISFDENSLAYVEKTILYKIGGEK